YVMFGFDTAGSLAEETKDPRRTTPSALLRDLGAAGTAGALLLLMALLTAKSLAPATLGVGGLPSVLEDALGSGVGKVLLADVAFAIFICCLAIHAASIRLAFSMARDHALPFGDHLSHVSAQRKSPALPAIAVGAVAIAILVVNFGNAQIFLVVTSVSIVIVYIAYLLVTVPAMLQRRRNGWPEDQGRTGWFFLGRRRGLLIIGGGVIGTSVAYPLTKLGQADVVLVEQGRLSCGTTWHAAGLVGQLRASQSGTRLVQYSTALYSELEGETGLSAGYKRCGGVTVARTPERMTQLKRTAATAEAFDLE